MLRSVQDPDEIIAFGFFEGDFTDLRDDQRFSQQRRTRLDRMTPYVDSTGADGLYEVVEEVTPS